MPLYFAYGSNMDRAAMAGRCPASTALGPARLARHRLIVTADGYASVVRDPRRTVWGLLWDIVLADMPALDRYEDVAGGLYVKVSQPVIARSGVRRALIYMARKQVLGQPRPGYLEGVVAGRARRRAAGRLPARDRGPGAARGNAAGDSGGQAACAPALGEPSRAPKRD